MTRKLIWAHERRDLDTGELVPDKDKTPVNDKGYGPIQGSRYVTHNYKRICVDTRDLWIKQRDGSFTHADCNRGS